MMSFGCCPLFAVAVGSVSCFMLCVSVSAFLWFWHRDGLWSLHTGLSLRAPTGVVCVFFPHACHVFLPVGLPAGLLCFLLCLLVVFLLWLFCWLCCVSVGVFCWLCLVCLVLSVCCLSAGLLACACFRLFCRVFGFSAFPACCVEFGCPRVWKCEFWFFPCFWGGWLLFRKQKLCTWADTYDIG